MEPLQRPENISPSNKVVGNKTQSYITANGYSQGLNRILSNTVDEVEVEVNYRAYDNMEKDATVSKSKRILITGVFADELQFSPGATEEQVDAKEYETFVQIMEFCERIAQGLTSPVRDIGEQWLGNALKYGHGIGEVEWEYRLDAPSSKPPEEAPAKTRTASLWSGFSSWWSGSKVQSADSTGTVTKPSLKGEKTRLMPSAIKIKPRDAAQFVVNEYMDVLGLVPRNKARAGLAPDEIVDREKFIVLTLNKKDEDPRGNSSYRPAYNWYNIKTQIPAEMLRFILEESVPKAVGTMAKDMPPFEFERDENGDVIYNDPDTKKDPRMLTGAESFKRQIEGFRSGSGAVIPYEAKLEPYKKGLTGSGDADLFSKLLSEIDKQIETSILLQTLAQSEGQHQSKSASSQVAEVLYNLIFGIRWQMSMALLYDLFSVAVKVNFGEWAIRYLPMISFGDFIRRDWVEELDAYADAYFKGFLDDTQRAEIMANLNLPKPGPSRQEQNMEAAAKQDVNGQPSQPNNNRPDKQAGSTKRNAGNGTEKKRNVKQNFGSGPVNSMGHNTGWFRRFTSHIRTGS